MSSFGVLDTGINIKTIEDILEELEDGERAAFGPAIDTSPESVMGQLNSLFGDKIAELWELGEGLYSSQYPDSAIGASLDGVAAYTGAERLGATQSAVTLQVNLDNGTTLAVGRVVSKSATGDRFVTTAAASNATGAKAIVSVAAVSEEYGPISGNAYSIDTIETPVSGWSAQAATVTANTENFTLANGQTLDIEVDGGATQTVTFVTGDFGDITNATAAEVRDAINANTTGLTCYDALGAVFMESDTDGAGSSIQVTGGTSNTALGFPTTLVSGLNADDAVLGTKLETDIDFRLRRESLIRLPGAGTLEAMRTGLLEVADVIQAFVFENPTATTDAYGIPSKAFEAVVYGGLDADIGVEIFLKKPLGIESYRDPGAQGRTESVTDSQGTVHTINFTRPTAIQMFTEVDISVDGSVFGGGDQAAGEQQVKDALAAQGGQQQIGDDVYIVKYLCAPLIAGVVDVTAIKIEDTYPPTNTANIPISSRELATFDTSDMVVNITVL